MRNKLTYRVLNFLIALVWLINGLYCKVLNFVPRHNEIVERVLQIENGIILTKLIGFSEIIMSLWILSNFKSKLNGITQIIVVATMNILEFFLAPDLLLWGKLNSLFAFIFIITVFINEFYLNPNHKQK
ncbi:MAG: DoxX-like family protein [Putridiphycobacter sp.]